MRKHLLPPALLVVGGAGLLVFGVTFPDRYALLLQEDGPVEWCTFWAFVAAAAVFLAGPARSRTKEGDETERYLAVGLAAFCLFVAGEEISWGQRLLGYQPPELFLARNYQQESNLHNLLKDVFESRWQVFLIAVGYGVITPLAGWRAWLPPPWAPHPAVIPAALVVLAIELFYPLELSGEVAEAVLGGLFLHDALLRWQGPSTGRQVLAMGVCVAFGVATPLVLDRTLYASSDAKVAVARSELEQLAGHVRRDGTTSRLAGRRRVHKRVFTAMAVGYLRAQPMTTTNVDVSDERRATYELDPWQQPYWILMTKHADGSPTILLYSFGPNRRRDTVLDEAMADGAMAGDDLGVSLRLE